MHPGPVQPSARARRVAAFIARRPWPIVLGALAVGALAAWLASGLRVNQEMRALLPEGALSTQRIDVMTERLGNQSDLYVAIRSPSRAANLRFGAAVAAALEGRPDVRFVLFHLDRGFFERSALLYADLEDLLDLRCRVIGKIRDEVRREMAMFPEDEAAPAAAGEDGLSEAELRQRYDLDTRLPEYYEADEGRLVVVKVRPTAPDTDVAFARRLSSEVAAAAAAIGPTSYHPEMTVAIEGSYAEHSRRVGSLEGDIARGSAIVVALLMLSLALYFRGLRAIALVLTPLAIAVAAALAFARVAYGALNMVSAFIFVVLLGLGVDFGIHVLARYQAERRRGLAAAEALAVTLSTTGVSTAAGALSTALTCFLLVVADFRGFSLFGVVAGVGVTLALGGALFVLPAMAVLSERLWPWAAVQAGGAGSAEAGAEAGASPGRRRFPWLAALVLGLGVGAAGLSASRLGELRFEYDLGRLDAPVRAADAAAKAAAKAEAEAARPADYTKAVGRVSTLAPAVALADDRAAALAVHRQLKALERLSAEDVARLAAGEAVPLPPPFDGCGRPPAEAVDEDPDEVIDDEDDDLADPTFVALAAKARQHKALDPAVAAALAAYPGPRLREMHDRLREAASIYSYVPELQEEKLAVIRDVRRRIGEKAAVLSPADQARLASWEPYLAVDRPIGVDDLPGWVRAQFTDARGEVGGYVVFWTKGGKADYQNSKRIYEALRELEVEGAVVPVAASFFVLPEIVDLIRADGPVVVGLSFAVLIALALAVFRGATAALLIFGTVASALLWVGGLLVALDWRLNFFNVIAFPLLIGMGQDDAVHLLHRHREGQGMGVTLRETGGAIFMTTLTTVLGYGGMLFADHLGLFSLGFTAAAGMILCLVASVGLLPAALHVGAWWRSVRSGR